MLPHDVLTDMYALEELLNRWQLASGDAPLSPELQARRDAMAARLAQYDIGDEIGRVRGSGSGYSRLDEIGHRFETSAQLNLPGRRRPTLSEYDNRRTERVDRYSFGIYTRE